MAPAKFRNGRAESVDPAYPWSLWSTNAELGRELRKEVRREQCKGDEERRISGWAQLADDLITVPGRAHLRLTC
jgi:hypothetical protein